MNVEVAATQNGLRWYVTDAAEVVSGVGTDTERGLSAEEATTRLAEFGPNELQAEPPRRRSPSP